MDRSPSKPLTRAEREQLLAKAKASGTARTPRSAHAVTPISRDRSIPLSFSQQRLWFFERMEDARVNYHVPAGVRLRGVLNVKALRLALDRIIARHEVLRTTFKSSEGQLSQSIGLPGASFQLIEHDLCTESDPEAALRALRLEEAHALFDLSIGPLIRGRLIRLAAEEHVLLITMHHIISDGWSIGVLIDELCILYEAFACGANDPLPALILQYADYVAWQRHWLSGPRLETQQNFWKTALHGAAALLNLPTDRDRPSRQDFSGAVIHFEIDETTTDALRALSRRQGTTLYMTVLTAWAIVLARLSGQEDLVIGAPVANRKRTEIERLIGLFVNTLPLRIDLSGLPTIEQLLGTVTQSTLAAQDHQDLPFDQIVEHLRPPRSLAHTPIFQVMFAWERDEMGPVNAGGLQVSRDHTPHVIAKYDLTLNMTEERGRIAGGLEYARSLFDEETIERHVGYLQRVLAAMVTDDQQRIDHIALLDYDERRLQLIEWNRTAADFHHELCIHQLIEAHAARWPDAPAVVYEEQSLSYGELNARANLLARYLRRIGVRPDGRVAVCMERSADMVVALLAILKAGGAYVPLDPSYPVQRLMYMLEDCEPTVLLTHGQLSEELRYKLCADTAVCALDLSRDAANWTLERSDNLDVESFGLTARHLAYVIYTSGSTGQPKGVMVEHRAALNHLEWRRTFCGLEADDVVLQRTAASFDISVWELWTPLISGARVALLHPQDQKDPAAIARAIARHGVTCAQFVPMLLRLVVEQTRCLQGIRWRRVFSGGEALDVQTAQLMHSLYPGTLVNVYGPTEAVIDATFWPCMVPPARQSIPLGRPIANTQIYIFDSNMQPVPRGAVGELHIGGVGIARGYWNRPELTEQRFVADPVSNDPNARLYKTGDMGRYAADGTIEFVGRRDQQVKLRGFRIELGEIEAGLAMHSAVREAAVTIREDSAGDKRLVAYLTLASDSTTLDRVSLIEALRNHIAARVPEYMIPAAYVVLDEWPLTPNGKLDRKALPAPEGTAFLRRTYEAPQGSVEIQLAAIWEQVLEVDRVGRHDNFFELGGHSLLALTVMERMCRAGLNVDVPALFAMPTPAQLAAVVDTSIQAPHIPPNLIPQECVRITPAMLPLVMLSQPEIDCIVTATPGGAANIQDIYPLTAAQAGILFHHLAVAQGDPYLVSAMYSFDGRERLERYVRALQAVIDRHDILRTAVLWEGLGEPVQVVWRRAAVVVEELQFGSKHLDAAQQLREHCDHRQYRLDPRHAPLMRLFIVQDAANDRWLMTRLWHHLSTDITTLETIEQELRAHLSGAERELAPPLPFRNFIAQMRLSATDAEHEAFFKKMLADVAEPTAPFGLQHARIDDCTLLEQRIALPDELSHRLRACSRALGVTAASLCHLAWGLVLARTAGREDVVFGTVLFGRMQGTASADRVLGMFINTLPVRIRIDATSVQDCVRNVHDLLTELLRHEQTPLSLAQRCSQVVAPQALFTALFNYRHSTGTQPEPADTASELEGIKLIETCEQSNYPLAVSVDDLGQSFEISVHVHASVEPQLVCSLMQKALEALADTLEKSPNTPVRALDVLPAEERHRLLRQWNGEVREYTPECVHTLFERHVAIAPSAIALEARDRSVSFGELNEAAERVAQWLRKQLLPAESLIGVCAQRSVELAAAMLGIWKAACVYVPLEPTHPKDRLRYLIADAQLRALLTQGAGANAVHWYEGPQLQLERLDEIALADPTPWHNDALGDARGDAHRTLCGDAQTDAFGATHGDERCDANGKAHAAAYVIYTSGSSGEPKGCVVEHHALSTTLESARQLFGFGTSDVMPTLASHSFDISLVEWLLPLVSGGRVRVVSEDTVRDLPQLIDQTQGMTCFHAVPSLMKAWLERATNESYAGLRGIMVGGEAVSQRLLDELQARFKEAQVYELYGPTEAVIISTYWAPGKQNAHTAPVHCIGQRFDYARTYVLDEQGNLAPTGVAGELCIGGSSLARGYLNRPELTAGRFVADPFSADATAKMYRTGDCVRYLVDGRLEYLGRLDQQVKLRGYRIEPGEIEAKLLIQPGIREAVVMLREDTPGEKRLVAYVTASHEALDTSALRAALAAVLPEYTLPSAYVLLPSLPHTANGKVDCKMLPAPDDDAHSSRLYEVPLPGVETQLAEIWARALKVDRVGRNDNFFELGGHSLLAVSVIERMRQRGLQTDVRALFSMPTLSALAASVGINPVEVHAPENLIPIDCERITPEMLTLATLTQNDIDAIVASVDGGARNVQDIYPLAPLQEGILFHHLMASSGDVYLTSLFAAFSDRQKLQRYVEGFQLVVERHDILRTAVVWEGVPEPLQVVWRRAPLSIEELHLDPKGGDVVEQLRTRFDPRHYRIELDRAPLIRLFIAEDVLRSRWVLLVLSHHLIGDHTTIDVLQSEVEAHLLGRTEQLPAPLPFRNFVAQSRLGVSRSEHEQFFQQMLGDITEPTMPFGLSDVQGDGSQIDESRCVLSPCLSHRVRSCARKLGVSTASVCHLAWAQVLARATNREDVVFGTLLFGRMHSGTGADRVLGMFINTLPVRISIGDESVHDAIKRTHAALSGLLRHEHASLALAQRCSGVAAPAPLFSALLNYRHIGAVGQQSDAKASQSPNAWEGIEFLQSRERTNYPLVLSVDDFGDALGLSAQAPSSIGPQRICAFMERALEQLVEVLEQAPERSVCELDVLPSAEREQIVSEWNCTTGPYPHLLLHEFFEAQVARQPHAVAIAYGDELLDYETLNAQANQLACYLRANGVARESLVGVCLRRTPQLIVVLLAIVKAGGAYVPLDPDWPSERIAGIVRDLALERVIGEASLFDLIGELRGLPIENLPRVSQLDDIAYVIFTSGSTGKPKGIVVAHRAAANLIDWVNSTFAVGPSDRLLFMASVCFDLSVYDIFGVLGAGGSLQLADEETIRDPQSLMSLLLNEPITFWDSAPAALQQVSSFFPQSGTPGTERLRLVFNSGDWIPVWLPDAVRRSFPRAQFIALGGATEATVWSNWYPVRHVEPHWASIPYGKPIRNARYYVLDRNMQPCPIGVVGSLYIGGECLADGYTDPEQTVQRFILSPIPEESGRLYHTGDLARYWSDGTLQFLGRADFQVKIRGYRIELEEIEAVLRRHASVHDAVVLLREDEPGDQRLIAYLIARGGQQSDVEQSRLELSYLDQSPLEQSRLERSCLDESHLERSRLELSYLDESHLERSRLERSYVDQSHLEESDLEHSPLERSHGDQSYLEQSHLEQSHLEQSHLEQSRLEHSHLPQPQSELRQAQPPALELSSVRAHAQGLLPNYMLPSAYVVLEAWPVSPNGKLDRKALPAPEGPANLSRTYEEPLPGLETQLARIWAEVLKVDRVGRHDHFFELGGHSLLAVSLIARSRKERLHVDVRSLFATPTIAELAPSVSKMGTIRL